MRALNGVSQMWLFSLYEFLRTWRQRATQILQLAEQYAKTLPRKQKAFLEKTIADAKGKEKHIFSGVSYCSEHVSRIADPDFVDSIKAYYDKMDGWFGFIEELRMNLAKHEVPKKGGNACRDAGLCPHGRGQGYPLLAVHRCSGWAAEARSPRGG
jgi:hypothetical protein